MHDVGCGHRDNRFPRLGGAHERGIHASVQIDGETPRAPQVAARRIAALRFRGVHRSLDLAALERERRATASGRAFASTGPLPLADNS
jgi:hypothetical protein